MDMPVTRRNFLKGASATTAVAGLAIFYGTGMAIAAGTDDGTTVTLDIDDTSDTIFYSGGPYPYGYNDWYVHWRLFTNVPGRSNGTAHSTQGVGARISYTHARCTRIQWRAATDIDKGIADVYVDGIKVATVDQYTPAQVNDVVIFDTGELPIGSHTIAIVTTGNKNPASRNWWTELDRFQVEAEADTPVRINDDFIDYIGYGGGGWDTTTTAPGFVNGDAHFASTPGAIADFAFSGSMIRWIGSRKADGGIAEVYVDDRLEATVDTYSAASQPGVVLFEKSGLSMQNIHEIRVQVTGKKNSASTGANVYLDAFDCTTSGADQLKQEAISELDRIKSGTKAYLQPSTWKPVAYLASHPANGVTLLTNDQGGNGPIKTAFEQNITYIKYSFGLKNWVEFDSQWDENWPDANEGRMLRGAGNALRWTEDADLRNIVDTVVAGMAARQQSDGFVMLWPEANMPDLKVDEQANYDRAMWTRGMVAAIQAGNTDAGPVLRRFYDWFNAWVFNRITDPTKPKSLLECSLGVQGHIGSTLTYFSPVGVPDDMVAADRYYVQDYWLQHLARRESVALWHYPLSRPHSYLIIGGEAFLDHYRATGAAKFLDGAQGMWDIFSAGFLYPGGGTSICEAFPFPPKSYSLQNLDNELDGAVFWADFNGRFLQLFPNDEKYATEIERAIYNTALANQEGTGNHRIRYHAFLHGHKDTPNAINTCCEGGGTQLFSEMPQFLYSVAPDGLYVNLYESSQITWQHQPPGTTATEVKLITSTRFPYDMAVRHTLSLPALTKLSIRIRIPSWATADVQVHINGHSAGKGKPGTYWTLNRNWSDGDTISYQLPAGFRVVPYDGADQVTGFQRFALEYGPILYALVGSWDGTYRQPGGASVPRLSIDPDSLIGALTPTDTPMEFTVAGAPGFTYRPYWLVQGETFSCFPIIQV